MADRFLARLLAELGPAADGDDPAVLVRRLCERTPGALEVSGAAVTVIGRGGASGIVSASNDTARGLEDIQFTLNEGPGLDAFSDHGPVLVPDLGESSRWTAYAPAALSAGAQAVFGFPLRLGLIKIGALTVHRDRAGELDVVHLNRAFAIAEAMTRLLLTSPAMTRSGRKAGWPDLDEDWTIVHQATGMVSVQLATSLDDALVRLRARAFASGRSVRDVAADVVARRLRMPRDQDPKPE